MNKPLTREEWLTYLDTTWKKCLADAWKKEWDDMTREDIIEMARRAGAHDDGNEVRFVELRYLERFAALVRADERKKLFAILRQMYSTSAHTIQARGNT